MRVKKKKRQTKIFNCRVKMNWKIALTKIKKQIKIMTVKLKKYKTIIFFIKGWNWKPKNCN
jgi:hypothetical protein